MYVALLLNNFSFLHYNVIKHVCESNFLAKFAMHSAGLKKIKLQFKFL